MSSTPVQHEWKTVPLRYVCQLNPSVDFSEFEEDDELTFLPMDRVKSGYFLPNIDKFSKYASSYNAFEDGDIVLAKVTPCFENGNIAVVQNIEGGKGFGSSELFVIRPKTVNRKFLFYYFQSSTFKQEGEASMTGAGGLKRVSPDLLRQHHLPCPNGEIQRLIADYLDRETARIDSLVAEKEKMLALLEEKRAALISRAVTRSLNPNAPLKPSGLDWLGDIPAHWETTHFKYVCDLNPAVDLSKLTADDEVTFLPMDRIKSGYYIENNEPFSKYNSSYNPFAEGDIIIAKVTPCFENGNIAIAENLENQVGFGSSEIFVIRPKAAQQRFIFYYLQSDYFKQQGEASMTGAGGLKRVSPKFVRDHFIGLPPMDEQTAITAFLDQQLLRMHAVGKTVQETIALLKERRAVLITAAVTGQIPEEEMNT
jgi:type I restriction enzyme, S subunit